MRICVHGCMVGRQRHKRKQRVQVGSGSCGWTTQICHRCVFQLEQSSPQGLCLQVKLVIANHLCKWRRE